MPKDLSDFSSWLPTAVPVGTDPANSASIEATFQRLTNRTKFLIDYIASLRLSNWFYVVHSGLTWWVNGGTPLTDQPVDICYNHQGAFFTAIDNEAITITSLDPGSYINGADNGSGGVGSADWILEIPNPSSAIGSVNVTCEIAAGGTKRVAVGDGYSAGGVAESPSIETWNLRATINAVAYHCVGYGGSLFAIGGASGNLETSADGITWVSRTSGISDTIRLIRHNGLTGGSAAWVALSDTRVSTSADGITWSSALHGMGAEPLRVHYDANDGMWRCILDTGENAYSSDDGSTWTVSGLDAFGLFSLSPILKYEIGITSDGQGGWVVTFERYAGTHPTVDSIDSRRFVIRGGGFSFIRTYSPRMYGCQRGGVCYGDGIFVTAGDDGGNFSLRVLEP